MSEKALLRITIVAGSNVRRTLPEGQILMRMTRGRCVSETLVRVRVRRWNSIRYMTCSSLVRTQGLLLY